MSTVSEAPFGAWLRGERAALDLTQLELAERIGCAEATIQRIEAGAGPLSRSPRCSPRPLAYRPPSAPRSCASRARMPRGHRRQHRRPAAGRQRSHCGAICRCRAARCWAGRPTWRPQPPCSATPRRACSPSPARPAPARPAWSSPWRLRTPPPSPPVPVSSLVDRAQAIDPRFALTTRKAADVAQLCTWQEGLPLGIELGRRAVPGGVQAWCARACRRGRPWKRGGRRPARPPADAARGNRLEL
jgi:hypothetical protein